MLKNHLRIGVDLHGVLTTYPEIFKTILASIVSHNIEIHVITGPPLMDAEEELLLVGYSPGIHYTHLHSVVDYLKEKRVPMWQDDEGHWWTDDENWWSSKAKICEDFDIYVIIDNNSEYKKYFENIETEFILVGESE